MQTPEIKSIKAVSAKSPELISNSKIEPGCKFSHNVRLESVTIGANVKVFENTSIYSGPRIGNNVTIGPSCNIYGEGVVIGDSVNLGTGVVIEPNVSIGSNTKIGNNTFLCSKVRIGKNCFISHGVYTANDKYPSIENRRKEGESVEAWEDRVNLLGTFIEDNVTIGTGAMLSPGITIGESATIGMGAVVTKSVPAGETWVGNPAKKLEVIDK